MTTKCTGLMGRIFGHKFKPVITLSSSGYNTAGVNCKAHVALEMADKYRGESFHGCVCQRCGEFVSQHKAQSSPDELAVIEPGFHKCTFSNNPCWTGVEIKGDDKGDCRDY